MINWTKDFKQPLMNILNKDDLSLTMEKTADQIAKKYKSAVSKAETIMTKDLIIPSTLVVAPLKIALIQSFNESFYSNLPLSATISKNVPPAVMSMWTTVMFKSKYSQMPPGHLSFIPPNKVIVPGIVNPAPFAMFTPLVSFPSPEKFLDAFILMFKAHLLTIGGLHAGIVPPAPAPPYPLPWIGVQ